MKQICLIILIIFLYSCSKEDNSHHVFGYLDLEDAYGIVLGKHTAGTDTSLQLFKINNTDNLVKIRYQNANRAEVQYPGMPHVMYDLNKTYFIITFKIGVLSYESYLIRKFDGLSQRLIKPVIAEVSGKTDMNIQAIRQDNNLANYYINSKGNWRIDLKNSQVPEYSDFLRGEYVDKNFTVDYLGNILTSEKVYPVAGAAKSLESVNEAYTYPLKSYINNMYYIFRKGDSVQCAKIDVSSETINEKRLYPSFLLNQEQAEFIGSHAFPESNRIIAILAAAILRIEGNIISITELKNLNLKRIFSAKCSGKFCFVYGENAVNDKVFVRIDFRSITPVYTQIVAPDGVEIKDFSVSVDDNLIFSGKRISDNKGMFGYIPFSGSNWIFDDDDGISDIQVLVL